MTATFWTGSSLSFTNGSKTVTVNTGPSLDSVKANSSLTAGNYNEPVEVKSVSGNTITLYNNWPGSTGTTSATIKPSAAAAASAGVAAQQLITDIQSLVGSASATATANSFVKRDSNGRIKASSPSTNDDVVTKGYFQSDAALNNAGIFHDGNSVNPLDYGLGIYRTADGTPSDLKKVSAEALAGGLYTGYEGLNANATLGDNPFPDTGSAYGLLNISGVDPDPTKYMLQLAGQYSGNRLRWRSASVSGFSTWREIYHSGNTNFNEVLGGGTTGLVLWGQAYSSTEIRFYIPIYYNKPAMGITVSGTFSLSYYQNPTSSGLDGGDITFLSSSKNLAVVRITGLSNLNLSREYSLFAEQASANIKVNF